MIKKDLIKEAATALSSNKVRTGLTVLGIVVGIASVIVLSAIGNGAKANITEQIESNGSNLITIVNGSPRAMDGKGSAQKGSGKTLTTDDYNAIKSIDNIAYSSPLLSKSAQLVVDGNNSRSIINGVNGDYKNIRNLELSSGSFISENNNKYSDKVIVLGSTLKTDLFNNKEAVGKQVRVNGIIFDVIGVLKSVSSGFNSSDDDAWIPFTTMQTNISGDKKNVSSILVSVDNITNIYIVSGQINLIISERHNIKEGNGPDFEILNQQDLLKSINKITSSLTLLLAAIGGISLFVGGIGIMNMMLTQVTERTKEIGLRKSLGAKNSDIKIQFLIEAVYITIFGGVIGIALGAGIAYIVSLLSVPIALTATSFIISFSVSVAVGIIFGLYPANKASRLSPIQALKYE